MLSSLRDSWAQALIERRRYTRFRARDADHAESPKWIVSGSKAPVWEIDYSFSFSCQMKIQTREKAKLYGESLALSEEG